VRRLVAVVLAMLLGVAVVGFDPVAAQAVSVRVTPEFFGMHDFDLAAPIAYGAVRFWDVGTTWSDLEPAQNRYQFAHLDSLVARALARHAKITLVLGSTPGWAATNPEQSSAIWLTRGSSSPPRDQADWTDYVSTVAKRYKGRIGSYQIWNEGGLPGFWSASPSRLARLTAAAYVVIKKVDPSALVVSTPMLPRQSNWQSWSTAYLTRLRDFGWPVDVFAIHSYEPDRLANPEGRVVVIKQTKALLRSARAPGRPLWDTETNYTSHAYFWPKQKIHGNRAAAWVARAFLDSLRLGISRTYWYGWNARVGHLGVVVGPHNRAAMGYATVRTWLVGSTFRGCTTSRGASGAALTRCSFLRGTKTSRVVWASATLHAHLSGGTICQLLTGCKARTTTQTRVTTSPVLVR
jgi:hypothetical protein